MQQTRVSSIFVTKQIKCESLSPVNWMLWLRGYLDLKRAQF